MMSSTKLFAAAAMIAAPAAAQYYPQPPYPQQGYPQQYPQETYPQQYPQNVPNQAYPYSNQPYATTEGAIIAVVDSMIGTRYAVGDRQAIHSCAWAAVQRARSQGPVPYAQPYGGYPGGYAQPYSGYAGAHVRLTGITSVEHRSNSVRVRGILDTGLYGARPYGYGGGAYGYGGGAYNGGGDTAFRCDVDYRGAVFNVRLDRVGRPY